MNLEPSHSENVSRILDLKEPPSVFQRPTGLRRYAIASCTFGTLSPLALALLFCLRDVSSSAFLFPILVSAAGLFLAGSTLIRILLAKGRKHGVFLALIGVVLCGGTLLTAGFLWMAAMAMESCPFLG